MTPDNFPTRAKYLDYVRECEASMRWQDWETTHTFESITLPVSEFGNHWASCKDEDSPYCWCVGDEYGLVYTYSPGMTMCQHTTHPMFEIKNDMAPHNYTDEGDIPACSWCNPERYYLGPKGGVKSRAAADRMWWSDQEYMWEGAYTEFFDEANLPRPAYEPDKNGPHP